MILVISLSVISALMEMTCTETTRIPYSQEVLKLSLVPALHLLEDITTVRVASAT